MINCKKIYLLLILTISISFFSSCGKTGNAIYGNNGNEMSVDIILENDYTNEKRNQLLKEDIEFLGRELPKRHINMFDHISREEFSSRITHLINRVDKLENEEILVEIDKIIALIGDAHTWPITFIAHTYGDEYAKYPILFYEFDDGIYAINADKSLEDILYSRVVAVNGMDIGYVKAQIKALIPHENENWVKAILPQYLSLPVYMYGLGIADSKEKISISFEKCNGEIVEKQIRSMDSDKIEFCVSYAEGRNVYLYDRKLEGYYWYEYLPENNTLYFKYNECSNMDTLPFSEFNKNMFNAVNGLQTDKIVVDLRNNTGGSDIVINPFLESLKKFITENPGTKVYIITGRETASSGVKEVLDIKKTIEPTGQLPAIVGEATGGSPNTYGEVSSFELPNSKIEIRYSTKYYALTDDGAQTITPDVELSPSINDFKGNNDVFMNYILNKNNN